jgi:hypothetical protein
MKQEKKNPEQKNQSPAQKPQSPSKENQGKDKNNTTNPGKPNNDPDQTPEREAGNPPVANPEKTDKQQNSNRSDHHSL